LDLKADKAWCLLRAAVPVGGRTLPVLDMVFPGKQQGTPAAEKRFLQRLRHLARKGSRLSWSQQRGRRELSVIPSANGIFFLAEA
jgi:hypothetical protein